MEHLVYLNPNCVTADAMLNDVRCMFHRQANRGCEVGWLFGTARSVAYGRA